ncbi:MAG: hypothetical protein IAX21_03405 [Candidatus Bathyarchaeota archaeon]|nr:hypothetical protein [Candidatus Bathyarchaeum tardum]WGM89943.1 MAG: hypothetical protein NUK63_02145 [Candidatus Bathyarchaeum tardum]WNZ29918.1 MAG: hypothetical protein IAX21_03405 [Candidatus Bathyarchaeota archaeon]
MWLSIFFVLVAAMVCNSYVAILSASATSNDSERPVSFEEFCQMYAMYVSNGDATEYERMNKVMISAGLTTGVPVDIPIASEPPVVVSLEEYQNMSPSEINETLIVQIGEYEHILASALNESRSAGTQIGD